MNSKGHLTISFIKSGVRIVSAIISVGSRNILPLAVGLIVAEGLGIAEELVDKR